MEYVSVLAGGKFTDHPRCTHPALATLARLVNDWIDDDDTRNGLALLAPDLIDTGRDDLRTTQCVVVSCLQSAAADKPLPPAVERRLTRTRQRIGNVDHTGGWARFRLGCSQLLNPPSVAVSSAFQVAVEQLRGLPRPERNAQLSKLLRDAVADCRQTVEVHPVGPSGARAG
ncbi:MAG: hypothetical protein DLM62_18380 [Pseudonocardiales bacterium]|nr:MAG: hypothetical protein DLM62_18380 [Pseudonocardiales bacterium]